MLKIITSLRQLAKILCLFYLTFIHAFTRFKQTTKKFEGEKKVIFIFKTNFFFSPKIKPKKKKEVIFLIEGNLLSLHTIIY